MDQTPVAEPTYDFKSAQKQFSRIGLALVAFFAATYAMAFLAELILVYVFAVQVFPAWLSVVVSCVGMYGIGVPVFCLCLRGMKSSAPPRGEVRIGTLCILFLIAYALMYVGNIAGMVSTALLEKATGLVVTSTAIDLLPELPWYITLLYAVLIGPFFEELVFRKMILDRTRVYGEKTAILFSALLFGFFHMNLQQFFYAVLIGLVFGYLYLRTGKLSACWVLHSLFNFFGGLLPSLLMQYVDYDALLSADTPEAMLEQVSENPIGVALVMLYGMLVMCLTLVGSVLFLLYRKRLHFAAAAHTLPSDSEATTAFVNVGVILFVALCVLLPMIGAAMVQFG